MAAAAAPAISAPAVVVKNKTMLTVAIMVAVVMQVLDTTIANVALPHMRASLGASQDEINWVLTSYIVAAAIATPLTGWFSDRFGRRNLLLGARWSASPPRRSSAVSPPISSRWCCSASSRAFVAPCWCRSPRRR